MTDEQTVGDVVVRWYRSSLNQKDGAGRSTGARLRRCGSSAEALAVAETHILNARLKKLGKPPTPDQLALLATTFARLKSIDGDKLAALFGKRKTNDEPPLLSNLRFQSLIRIRSHHELLVPLRRSLAVLGPNPACNGRALAEDLYRWNDRVRNTWCFQYFGAEFAAADEGETVL